MAQVDDSARIEPLPDIDFNIRSGNTLVGYLRREDVEAGARFAARDKATQVRMLSEEEEEGVRFIEEQAEIADRAFLTFRLMQLREQMDTAEFSEAKAELSQRLQSLREQLNQYLAAQYGVDPRKTKQYERWLGSHRPFHWFTEFYGVMKEGGFAATVGNPPYVSRSKIDYTFTDPSGLAFPDIYAHMLLQVQRLTSPEGRHGMIVPLSVTFSDDYSELRQELCHRAMAWFSSYDNIPASVFAGVSQRCTIWLGAPSTSSRTFASPMYRWRSEYRPVLTQRITYTSLGDLDVSEFGIPRCGTAHQLALLRRISGLGATPPPPRVSRRPGAFIGFSGGARNFVSAFLAEPPCLSENGLRPVEPTQIGYIQLATESEAGQALSMLSGEFYLWYWLVRGDGFHVTSWVVRSFLGCMNSLEAANTGALTKLGELLHSRRFEALVFKKNAGRYVGNFNYQRLPEITRRSDLLVLAGLGCTRDEALGVLDYVDRVLSINVHAGEKSIPEQIKAMFQAEPRRVKKEAEVFRHVDAILMDHFGLAKDEIAALINSGGRYRPRCGSEGNGA